MTDLRIAVLALVLLLTACGEPRRSETPSEPPSAPPPAASAPPRAEPSKPEPATFYVGRWAASQEQCATEPWTFTRASLQAAEGTCTFDEVAAIPTGFSLKGTCQWQNAQVPADIKVAFAQSAQALLVSGRPVGDVGLTACPG